MTFDPLVPKHSRSTGVDTAHISRPLAPPSLASQPASGRALPPPVLPGASEASTDTVVTERPRRQLRERRATSTSTSTSAAEPKRWRKHSRSPYREVKFVDEREKTLALGPAPVTYYALVALISVFVMLGLVMVLSASSASRVGGTGSPYTIFIKQSIWAGLGLVAMLIVAKVPYQRWRLFVIPGFLVAIGLMFTPFLPGIGTSVNDARSWIRIGPFSLQPSEFLKLASICFLADYFSRNAQRVHRRKWGLGPFAVVTFGGAGLAFVQGDLGSAIVLAAAMVAVAVIAGLPMRHIGVVMLVGVIGATGAVLSSPRRFNRLTAFLDTQGNKDDVAFQSWQGLLSIANGGLTGSGIGGSRSKMGYLPLAHSDFIFAVIADELGFVGSIAVVGGFILLVWLGLQVARAAPDQFGTILAAGIAAWFGVQAIVNLGGVVGIMPVTGLTLPFFSAGGTSLFVSMIAAALLINIARRGLTDASAAAAARASEAEAAQKVDARRTASTASARPARSRRHGSAERAPSAATRGARAHERSGGSKSSPTSSGARRKPASRPPMKVVR